ncbi:ATP-NAD kinase-like domain-containing protein [Phellopilus nigrolimitatus]|nr:ATP-NAD kinase-like domain-containing protein [Phellopilus nigrolimitatus]
MEAAYVGTLLECLSYPGAHTLIPNAPDVETRRRLRVLVNPHGGPGKARQIYTKTVEPIFQAARCEFETTFTERSKHATDIAKELSLERKYDALVLLSGDGLIHEVYNGFAEHDDPLTAFSIPIAPIPTGSANGTSINLLGVKDGFDVGLASLNAIKGKPMKLDICSTTIGDERVFTYMSQAMGLMADVDLGTERLRWMGDLRFVLGFIYYGVFKLKTCPMTLAIKPVETDKDRMVEEFRARAEPYRQERLQRELDEHQLRTGKDSLPLLEHTEEPSEDDGWITFDKPILYLYAGKSPYVARDLMQFPVAHPSDGLIDIVAQELTSRGDLFGAIDGAERGATFWKDTQHYFKARAYRVTPHTAHGNLSIDGERYPLQPFAVECHRALGALLSPTGRYAADFAVPRPAAEKQKNRRRRAGGGGSAEGQDWKKRGWRKWTGCC